MWKKKLALIIYRFITLLFLPLALFLLTFRILTKKEDAARVIERFGFSFASPNLKLEYIWIHAASIGEMNVAIDLIQSLTEDGIEHHFLLTTQTLSAARVFDSKRETLNLHNCIHHFLPYDIVFIADYFLQKWKPKLAIFVESEIWPLYLNIIKSPILLLNARISERSVGKWLKIKKLATIFFANFTSICAATIEDQKRYQKVYKNAQYFGNIKLCSSKSFYKIDTHSEFSEFYKFHAKPVVMFASTSVDEIDGLIGLIHANHHKYNFIFAPRHIEDATVISEKLGVLQLDFKLRTEHQTPHQPIYIANTYNELGLFFSVSDVVFIGGSIYSNGGQNMLEPIKLDTPTIVGPYTYNFQGIMDELRKFEAIEEVKDFKGLEIAIDELINNSTKLRILKDNIKQFNNSNSDIMLNYKKVVQDSLKN